MITSTGKIFAINQQTPRKQLILTQISNDLLALCIWYLLWHRLGHAIYIPYLAINSIAKYCHLKTNIFTASEASKAANSVTSLKWFASWVHLTFAMALHQSVTLSTFSRETVQPTIDLFPNYNLIAINSQQEVYSSMCNLNLSDLKDLKCDCWCNSRVYTINEG